MTRRQRTNLAASVHQLLMNKARDTHRPFNELLQYYAMERFLYRLSKSPYASKFILKGALMFTAWKLESYRPTVDTEIIVDPVALTSRFADDPEKNIQWRGFIRKSRLDYLPNLAEVISMVAAFLCPVATALTARDPFRGKWAAPGP